MKTYDNTISLNTHIAYHLCTLQTWVNQITHSLDKDCKDIQSYNQRVHAFCENVVEILGYIGAALEDNHPLQSLVDHLRSEAYKSLVQLLDSTLPIQHLSIVVSLFDEKFESLNKSFRLYQYKVEEYSSKSSTITCIRFCFRATREVLLLFCNRFLRNLQTSLIERPQKVTRKYFSIRSAQIPMSFVK